MNNKQTVGNNEGPAIGTCVKHPIISGGKIGAHTYAAIVQKPMAGKGPTAKIDAAVDLATLQNSTKTIGKV